MCTPAASSGPTPRWPPPAEPPTRSEAVHARTPERVSASSWLASGEAGPLRRRPRDWQGICLKGPRPQIPPVSLLQTDYELSHFFDEMFAGTGDTRVRPHYRRLAERLGTLDQAEFDQRRAAIDAAFLRRGVTFTVYNDSQGTERIFPFDLIPRIIPATEWSTHRSRPGPAHHRAQPLPRRHLPRAAHAEGRLSPPRSSSARSTSGASS
jgi:hypothetical protein